MLTQGVAPMPPVHGHCTRFAQNVGDEPFANTHAYVDMHEKRLPTSHAVSPGAPAGFEHKKSVAPVALGHRTTRAVVFIHRLRMLPLARPIAGPNRVSSVSDGCARIAGATDHATGSCDMDARITIVITGGSAALDPPRMS